VPEPVYTVTLDEKRKRDAVLAALTDANNKHKLGLAAMIHGIPEKVLAHCVHHQSLGTLTQAQINWLAVDLRN
jgi:hypothetical protein